MIKTVRHAPGFYGVRRQAKRDAALASKAGFDIRHKHKPKRRRASLAAALVIAVTDTFNHAQGTGRNALEADVCYTRKVVNSLAEKDGES